MSRVDLLALTPAAIASLANVGLVKRAQREIAEGRAPRLDEEADGTVTGSFADGVVARLPPGVALRDAPCTCGATTACRHRVAVALAYPGWAAARGAAPDAAATEGWSPGAIDDDALVACLGKRALERARALVRAGCDVELRRAAGGVPVASLPTTSVQFLVPRDLAYARCTCVALQSCEHVAVAVWAFREADTRDPGASSLTVHLKPARDAELGARPLDEVAALAAEVLLEGVAHLSPALAAKLARAQSALEAAGMTWPGTILTDLGAALTDYRERSARYRPYVVASLLAELSARVRAASQPGELPAAYVLGLGEARETPLSHVRLVSLGARVSGHGQARDAEVYLADPASGIVLVLEKEWAYAEGETPQDGPALGERSVVPGVRLRDLARGDVVTRVARRMANRALRLGAQRRGSTSVMPQAESWTRLEPPVVVADVAALADELRARPPRLVRPRVLAESVRVVAVAHVGDVAYAPGDQALSAVLADAAGHELLLRRRHRAAAPRALDALAAALHGAVRFVSGEVRVGRGGLELDPIAVVTDRLLVPDLEAAAGDAAVPLGEAEHETSDLAAAMRDAWTCLEEAAHQGLVRLPASWRERAERCLSRCEALGLGGLAQRLERLRQRVQALQAGGPGAAAVEAWQSAAVRLALTRERA